MATSKKEILMWPDCLAPSSDQVVKDWQPGSGLQIYGDTTSTNIAGTVTCDNETNTDFGQTVRTEGKSQPYTEEGGHKSTRTTKGRDKVWSSHWIGSTLGLSLNSDGNVIGPDLKTATISSAYQASFLRRVVGFVCEISSAPDGTGNSADGSGRCEKWNISANYVNSSGQVKVYNMCEAGIKIEGHTYNSTATNTWHWYLMSYKLKEADRIRVIDQDLRHIGWSIQYLHHKFTGGDTKSKYCTGRVRYLQPLVGDKNFPASSPNPPRFQIQASRYTTWMDAQINGKEKIYTY
tara:strand:+ start:5126 stop:6001 length:876 start_codon:yes stop_codon:yes gene_type:complete